MIRSTDEAGYRLHNNDKRFDMPHVRPAVHHSTANRYNKKKYYFEVIEYKKITSVVAGVCDAE
jgi:hypothetical protein